ncbi:DUF4949 domain-containing protein [Legionella antarctica]|uniref:DUF4949 domain-containing protein n=1 Tax=Legionella antarctica TaxID=2708020 RepID=A0A6F8T4D2_9GAMM|nr:DUF4949 domain-containing protein [Legionella antarctica]BCA94826.1 DUF4949 domain-containing protein [Legionella antarctica]
MMLRSKLTAFAGALILAGSAFSSQETTCPDINDIKAEGLSMAEQIGPDIYLTYNISTYNTASNWGFIIAPLLGDSDDVALDAANEILSTMNAPGVIDQHSGAMVCTYETGHQNVVAAAIKDDETISPMKLKQYFQKNH